MEVAGEAAEDSVLEEAAVDAEASVREAEDVVGVAEEDLAHEEGGEVHAVVAVVEVAEEEVEEDSAGAKK